MKNYLKLFIAASILNLLFLVAAIVYFAVFGGVNVVLPGLGLVIGLDFLIIMFLLIVEVILLIASMILYRYNRRNFLK